MYTKSMACSAEDEGDPRRKILKMVVCSLCYDAGCSTVENIVAETLVEMMQSFLCEAGRSSQAYCELSGRTTPMLSDVVMSLIEMGTKIDQIPIYAKKPNKNVFIPPTHKHVPPLPGILETGERKHHPSYIQDYFPPFPGPHSYIRTPTYRDPVTDYQLVREKVASQKRDTERALTRFIANTGKTQKLFNDDSGAFPLIAMKPNIMPYLNALLPKDQDLDAQLPVQNQWANIMQKYNVEGSKEDAGIAVNNISNNNNNNSNSCGGGGGHDFLPERYEYTQTVLDVDNEAIDNPYLRPVKPPRKKRR
ncbi:transcription initiation factor TFIID subunit 8 [Octopus bimaculoides]|uniref:Transcription initiation factor TFIID subunit 8 n=1 Tax=Octopus bimaculoides TaxID=37653 RepID=A0A0L8GZA4_OCTBM|nr:transcription initiation factor TFIID subunit 8 [Octopus bimaculoides]|eukprot:XP_014776821.1 PREDICTED: transcription initiation factor TFIID subunit 8-like [Octopus bimaculoides]